jgi:hypothetical protein
VCLSNDGGKHTGLPNDGGKHVGLPLRFSTERYLHKFVSYIFNQFLLLQLRLRAFVPSRLRAFAPSRLRAFRAFAPSHLRAFVLSRLRAFAPSFIAAVGMYSSGVFSPQVIVMFHQSVKLRNKRFVIKILIDKDKSV